MSTSLTYQLRIPAVKFQFTHVNLFENIWLIQFLPPLGPAVLSPSPLMKAIFFSSPPPDTLTAGVCSSPATLQQRPTLCIDRRHWERLFPWPSPLLDLCANIVAASCFISSHNYPLFSRQMNPIMLQCASSSGYINSDVFRDEKLNMTVQMSSCPPRGIAMYTQLVVGFNCDIYGMRESNICAPFLQCQSFPEDSFFFFPQSETVH